MLPARKLATISSLGEGLTPLVHAGKMGARLGVSQLWIKDEAANPTGLQEARQMACAVSVAAEQGARSLALAADPSAAIAMSAYTAAAGIRAQVFLPRSAAAACCLECRAYGAEVVAVEGGPEECLATLSRHIIQTGARDLSAWREPYRLEGAKTVAFELAEQFNWVWPEVIVSPFDDGLALAGIWKAVQELEVLGWLAGPRPRLVAVVTGRPGHAGCSLGEAAVRDSGGVLVEASQAEALSPGLELASLQGILPAPEAAACLAALPGLLDRGALGAQDRVVVVNPRAGHRSLETYGRRLGAGMPEPAYRFGGLITPR